MHERRNRRKRKCNGDIQAISREINELQDSLVRNNGWGYPDILCELYDMLKQHHPEALRDWNAYLKTFPINNNSQAEEDGVKAGREKWIKTWVKTSLPRAVAKACQERGNCEWQGSVMVLLARLEKAGVDTTRIDIKDGWGEEEDYPYYWAGNGEFQVGYNALTPEELTEAKERILDALEDLHREGALRVEDTGTEGNSYAWAYVKATIL